MHETQLINLYLVKLFSLFYWRLKTCTRILQICLNWPQFWNRTKDDKCVRFKWKWDIYVIHLRTHSGRHQLISSNCRPNNVDSCSLKPSCWWFMNHNYFGAMRGITWPVEVSLLLSFVYLVTRRELLSWFADDFFFSLSKFWNFFHSRWITLFCTRLKINIRKLRKTQAFTKI